MGEVRVKGTPCDVVEGSARDPRSTTSRTPRTDDASRSETGGTPCDGDGSGTIDALDEGGGDTLRLCVIESADAALTEATACGVLRRAVGSARGDPGGASPRDLDLVVAGDGGDVSPGSKMLLGADEKEPPTKVTADPVADVADPLWSDVSK